LTFLSAYSVFADTNSPGSKNFIIIDDNSANSIFGILVQIEMVNFICKIIAFKQAPSKQEKKLASEATQRA